MTDQLRERWQAAGEGWRRRADEVQAIGMPVSAWMVEQLHLQPGQEVLELAAGPGDTGFLAAELVKPGGRLISSDAVAPMLEIARERSAQQGIDNIEFKLLELEWIDLPTATVDAILCRWGLMLVADPDSAAREMRRVLRPGGRVALAVWDSAERNPWASIPMLALVELGHLPPPDPATPGMFALAGSGRLTEVLEIAGFTEVTVDVRDLTADRANVETWLEQTLDLSRPFAEVREQLDGAQWRAVVDRVRTMAEPFTTEDGAVRLPAQALVASAGA